MHLDPLSNTPGDWKEAPRARALRLLQSWIKTGELGRGTLLPSERQLAIRLGVSVATTQRALSLLEQEGLLVRKDRHTRRVAEAAIDSSVLSHTILIFTGTEPNSDIDPHSGFIKDIGHGALKAIGDASLHAMVLHPGQMTSIDFAQLLQHRPMGVLVSDLEAYDRLLFPELIRAMTQASVPFVVFGEHGFAPVHDQILTDHETGEYEIVRWLVNRGRRRLLCVFPDTRPELAAARYGGYCRAMAEAGLEALPMVRDEMNDLVQESTPAVFRVRTAYFRGLLAPLLKDSDIDAILAINDRQAFEIGAACRSLGHLEGDRLLVAGYDNFYREANPWERDLFPAVPAATVDKRNYDIGLALVQLLLERIEGRLPQESQVRKVSPVFLPLR
ncbi:DNA-binding transcriptional regulator, LacI/PurR family [Verrucomicrobium sp. GAS474]|uniref:LacI family DNA-binding transcriptional regulator n=1 Tax=Verrucomicrobium sp. GAS474 TaxID=1882831 RepID=UPI00087B05A1|nr:LacI family DNA-binding transcriptional regulator [Verrucomicrobium sp. GAS474]SDT93952.1 DNA-binding transcriptional regulator, LacI/PurR family [Verrucomicrobium sp. GAS474]